MEENARGSESWPAGTASEFFVLANSPGGIDVGFQRKLTNGFMGRMEPRGTIFLPFPCISGVWIELLLWLDSLPLEKLSNEPSV